MAALTTLAYALAVLTAVAMLGALAGAAAWAARHDHSRGHCGWSGCQADARAAR